MAGLPLLTHSRERTFLTGALWLDGYNLVLFLTLLGASVSDLAWLPVVNYAGIALHVLVVALWPIAGDAKRVCVANTVIARTMWLGTVFPAAASDGMVNYVTRLGAVEVPARWFALAVRES